MKATTICGENGGCDSPEYKKNAKKFTFSHVAVDNFAFSNAHQPKADMR